MKIWTISALFLCLLGQAQVHQNSSDSTIYAVCDSLLSFISVQKDEPVNWVGLKRLFIPEARLSTVVKTEEGNKLIILSLDRFQEVVNYSETGFFEKAINRDVWIKENTAIVKENFVAGASRASLNESGINFYNLVNEDGQWRILFLMWEND